MEPRQAIESAPPPSDGPLRPYHTPTLTAYGSVAKLTQGPSGELADGASGMARPERPLTREQ